MAVTAATAPSVDAVGPGGSLDGGRQPAANGVCATF